MGRIGPDCGWSASRSTRSAGSAWQVGEAAAAHSMTESNGARKTTTTTTTAAVAASVAEWPLLRQPRLPVARSARARRAQPGWESRSALSYELMLPSVDDPNCRHRHQQTSATTARRRGRRAQMECWQPSASHVATPHDATRCKRLFGQSARMKDRRTRHRSGPVFAR